MDRLVNYQLEDGVATVTMDDGKVNALSLQMFSELNAAFDRAAADEAVVLFTGRPGVFSAGFDLGVLRGGGTDARDMLQTGFELSLRILSFPAPVVVACTGHALAMGVFLVLSGDHRVGALGDHRIGAIEVAIGLTMPRFGVEICRQRLGTPYFHRAVINAEVFSPDGAVAAGFLDEVVPAPELPDRAGRVAADLAKLDKGVHTATKLRAREQALTAVRAAIDADGAEGAT
jgi:enoyl-CoA hydratase